MEKRYHLKYEQSMYKDLEKIEEFLDKNIYEKILERINYDLFPENIVLFIKLKKIKLLSYEFFQVNKII